MKQVSEDTLGKDAMIPCEIRADLEMDNCLEVNVREVGFFF